ncbi:MAG: asparagine synthetase A, partial [Candidatus Hermodarchaeota archaeon]|nr:asparagine synthetase A [Candidatus Hermodarchaeota archaeon]
LFSAFRRVLDERDFLEILAPIIGSITDPGIRGAEPIKVSFYGASYVLMTSMIFHKQMVVASYPRVYAFSPNVRLEPPSSQSTGRHLAEFYQLDLEVAHSTCEEVMSLGDTLLYEAITTVRTKCTEPLEALGRTLPLPPKQLPRIPYTEALEILSTEGFHIEPWAEIPWAAEHHLSSLFETPFWVTDYPLTARGFYYLRAPKDPDAVRSMDLLLPEGFGEIASGGERENTVEVATERIRATGEDPRRYHWYLEMLRAGIPPSAGFGIGIERLTRYLTGSTHIWECSPFPKVPGVV